MSEQRQVISRVLREKGYRLTSARRTILDVILSSGGHLTADQLADLVRKQAPGIGRMTVYRTLDLLGQLNLIRPVYQGTGAAHFVLLTNGHHHHLICSNCDAVIEFDDCMLAEITQSVALQHEFKVQGHLLEFFGVCRQCQQLESG